MGVIIAVWLSRLEAAILLGAVELAGRLVSILLPRTATANAGHPRHPLYGNHQHAHTAPGLWYVTPRTALISWTVAGAAWAAHRHAAHTEGRGAPGLRAP